MEAVGGIGTVAAARKGSAELLGRIGPAYGLKLIRVVKCRLLISSVMNEHVGFLSENKKGGEWRLVTPRFPGYQVFSFSVFD